MCLYVKSEWSQGQIWGTACSNFPFLGWSRSINTCFCFSLACCLFHNPPFNRPSGSLPKVSSSHTGAHMYGCVCFPFCLFFAPADIDDSWSLLVCEQGRVRMRTVCVSRLREHCFPDVDRETLSGLHWSLPKYCQIALMPAHMFVFTCAKLITSAKEVMGSFPFVCLTVDLHKIPILVFLRLWKVGHRLRTNLWKCGTGPKRVRG